MHKVNVSEVSGYSDARAIELVARVEPPINLDPKAVQQFVGHGNLNVSRYHDNDAPLSDVSLIGSNEEATTIFAIMGYYDVSSEALKGAMAERIVMLIELLGSEASVGIIE